jgi:hypothetical protein
MPFNIVASVPKTQQYQIEPYGRYAVPLIKIQQGGLERKFVRFCTDVGQYALAFLQRLKRTRLVRLLRLIRKFDHVFPGILNGAINVTSNGYHRNASRDPYSCCVANAGTFAPASILRRSGTIIVNQLRPSLAPFKTRNSKRRRSLRTSVPHSSS